MNSSKKLSRRDWFRLRIPSENRMLDESATADTQSRQISNQESLPNNFKPLESPPNHDGLDLSELPPMREATLTSDQVIALFEDIGQLATDVVLMQRTSSTSRPTIPKSGIAAQLSLARASLLDGSIRRLQIRYCWQDSLWIDTLKRESDGFHIVRIAHKSK